MKRIWAARKAAAKKASGPKREAKRAAVSRKISAAMKAAWARRKAAAAKAEPKPGKISPKPSKP
jgi:hypothetical protein